MDALPRLLVGAKPGENLDNFMKREVWPDEMYKIRSSEVVDRLKTFMEHNTTYSINRVFVSGSMGKMTDLKDSSDVDLVVYINDYPTMPVFMSNLPNIINRLKRHLLNDLNWARQVNNVITTKYGINFDLLLEGYSKRIHVDLLPALDLPGKLSKEEIIAEERRLMTKDEKKCYSICFTQMQAEFVKPVPSKVKDLIRLLKYWKNTEKVPGKSYFVELLVIYLWRDQWGKPERFNMSERFRDVITKLKDITNMEITWSTTYEPQNTTLRPVLLDPINPVDNVAPSGVDVMEISRKAANLLTRMGHAY